MSRAQLVSAAMAVAVTFGMTKGAVAQDPPDLFLEHLSEYTWIGSSGGNWQTSGNWMADDDPTPPEPSLSLGYPSDPGRDDTNAADIVPLVGANFASALANDLTVNIGAGNAAAVASVKLGGTGSAVTTSIAGQQIVFENQESNNGSDPFDPETEWSFNQGRALIWSTGTAGAGKENRFDADIFVNDDIDVEGDRDLHIYGDLIEGDRMTVGGDPFRPSSVTSMLSGGARLYVHGTVQTDLFDEIPEEEEGGMGTQDRDFGLNTGRGVVLPEDPEIPPDDFEEVFRTGIIDMMGQFVGEGLVAIGNQQSGGAAGTVILRADNIGTDAEDPVYDGQIDVGRGNLVLDHDNALGGGEIRSGANGGLGTNFISTSDDRVIGTDVELAQWHTVRGATGIAGLEEVGDHSIEFSGTVRQTNTRGWINLLPEGTELVISGPQYPLEGDDNSDPDRIYTVDGTGLTRITGGIHNRPPESTFEGNGHFRKRGTGTVIIDYDEANTEDVASSLTGHAWVEGGNLHFATIADLPEGTGVQQGAILSRGGAVGLDLGLFSSPGVVSSDGNTFLSKLNNVDNPNVSFVAPFFQVFFTNNTVFTTYSHGGLMLGADEYDHDLDFNSGPLSNAANMSLAAQEGGSTYTGTITPSTSIVTDPNTYQLGGGSGTLTLPNNNQLVDGTNPRSLVVKNGGEVLLEGTNSYTGPTRIVGRLTTTEQADALTSGVNEDFSNDQAEALRRSTLSVMHLPNGNAPSSIGNTSSAAENLVIQGGSLRYVGAATTTDRLFTVGTNGAGIESSGAGTLTFSSTAALTIDTAEPRNGVTSPDAPGNGNNEIFGRHSENPNFQFSTEDLVSGMRITSAPGVVGAVEGLTISSVPEVDVVTVGGVASWDGFNSGAGMFSFGPAPARFLTLGGSNTGDNTFAPLVGNAPDIGDVTIEESQDGFGTVGIRKTGPGKWILTNDNTYSGETQVEEGTLVVNGMQSGGGLTTVSNGALLAGNGGVGGSLTNNGNVAPGTSAGTLTVNGDYTQSVDGTLEIELGGSSPGTFDVVELIGTEFVPVEGDYNSNGVVDTADYTVWRDHLGQTFQLDNEGDGISAGTVDQADYDFWVSQFGAEADAATGTATLEGTINVSLINGFNPSSGSWTILTADSVEEGEGEVTLTGAPGFSLTFNPTSLVLNFTGSGSGSLGAGAVPEPTSALLVLLAFVGFAGSARRRH